MGARVLKAFLERVSGVTWPSMKGSHRLPETPFWISVVTPRLSCVTEELCHTHNAATGCA